MSVATTGHHYLIKAAMNNSLMNRPGCVPIKFYLKKKWQVISRILVALCQ